MAITAPENGLRQGCGIWSRVLGRAKKPCMLVDGLRIEFRFSSIGVIYAVSPDMPELCVPGSTIEIIEAQLPMMIAAIYTVRARNGFRPP